MKCVSVESLTSVPDVAPGESTLRFLRGPMAARAVRLASLCLIWASSCCCICAERRKTRPQRNSDEDSVAYISTDGCETSEDVRLFTFKEHPYEYKRVENKRGLEQGFYSGCVGGQWFNVHITAPNAVKSLK